MVKWNSILGIIQRRYSVIIVLFRHGKGFLRKNDGQDIEGIWDHGKLIDVIEMDQNESPLEQKKSKVL